MVWIFNTIRFFGIYTTALSFFFIILLYIPRFCFSYFPFVLLRRTKATAVYLKGRLLFFKSVRSYHALLRTGYPSQREAQHQHSNIWRHSFYLFASGMGGYISFVFFLVFFFLSRISWRAKRRVHHNGWEDLVAMSETDFNIQCYIIQCSPNNLRYDIMSVCPTLVPAY